MSVNVERMRIETGNKHSKTMRIHHRIYSELDKLRKIYGEQHQLKLVTFNDFMLECVAVAELILTGQEMYEANGKVFGDIESARGEAIVASASSGKPAVPPCILLKLGKDELLK